MKKIDKIFLLGVGIANLSQHEVLEFIYTGLQKQTEKYYIVTPNPELLVIAQSDNKYKKVLNSAKLALPDGIGVIFASRLLGKPLKARVQGVDLMESLCKEASKRPITVGFLGAGPNVAVNTAECLQKKYRGLEVGLVLQEWKDDLKDSRDGKTRKKVDILFVAFGSPKQEIWIFENLNKIPAKVTIGVGGAFDLISGKVPRAPKILRKIGLEWLFRLIVQPWRIKRQLSLIKFVFLVFREKWESLLNENNPLRIRIHKP